MVAWPAILEAREHRGAVLRGEQGSGGGAWRLRKAPGKSGFGRTRGREGGLAGGVARGPARWPTPAYGRRHGMGAGREVEDGVRGDFINKAKYNVSLLTKFFSLFLRSNEKLLNTKLVQNFKIYNFCFRHFFI